MIPPWRHSPVPITPRQAIRAASAACLFALLILAPLSSAQASIDDCEGDLTPSNQANPIVELVTPLGSICIELFEDQAPITVANFLAYHDAGAWVDTFVQRKIANFIIQAGGFTADADGLFERVEKRASIANETCTLDQGSPGNESCSVRGNELGTLAMAKIGDCACDAIDPGPSCAEWPQVCVPRPDFVTTFYPRAEFVNSASSEWFINLKDNRTNLDNQNGGFTVFAQVLGNGMNIADEIGEADFFPGRLLPYSLNANPQTLINGLTSMPVQFVAEAPLPVYGCFDVTDLALIFATVTNPATPAGTFEFNSETGQIRVESAACGTLLANSNDYEATPSQGGSCSSADQLGVQVVNDDQLGLYYSPSALTAPRYQFACQELDDSVAGLAARRNDLSPLIADELMRIGLPEPSSALLSSLSLTVLLCLANARRRTTAAPQ